ncbi:divalent metal cation transporter [Stieleria sp. JC731]|uniref:divalent metal cation transporter n=1 Tax=Pirellulaceae TaxID=2691357 RepID=UPI001E62BED5|nr:divalent metal cation transporter [Stieleria sp. JC731]MCC9603622.1 divalent metal cation transporter [Stieleria sp. JC731]
MSDRSTQSSDATPVDSGAGDAKVQANRQILLDAQASGKPLGAYIKLSGPGWLQAAITLGGGSLAGALFLGVLGGTSMLWLQLIAIIMGVVMLSAISYVTLSTGRRPFEAINSEINPALGWGWVIATAMANIIWCMPQFSLCYDAVDKNLATLGGGGGLGDGQSTKIVFSIILLLAAGFVVLLNTKQGKAAKAFDIVLKSLVGMVVICFFGVVIMLAIKGQLDFATIFTGFIPDLSQWSHPAGQMRSVVESLDSTGADFWTGKLVDQQRTVMIAAAATAVGINMTFLLPYSMLARGWDKPFRGLARFDLSTGMAIPYVLVTSCVVIAAAASLHNKIDDQLASSELATMQTSPYYGGVEGSLIARVGYDAKEDGTDLSQIASVLNDARTALGESLSESEATALSDAIASTEATEDAPSSLSVISSLGKIEPIIDYPAVSALPETKALQQVAEISNDEKRVALSLVKRDAFQLSTTLEPLLGASLANLVFGLGVFGMGFSTIVILMLINGFAFREMFNRPDGTAPFVIGCLVAGISGAMWWKFWADADTKFWLAIFASNFGMMLLPIAYITFFLMMNNKRILGDEKPTGGRMIIWNVLMIVSVAGAIVAASSAIYNKINDPVAFPAVMGMLVVYAIALVIGYFYRKNSPPKAV